MSTGSYKQKPSAVNTEQAYAALNAEMEAKTAELLSEVDSVLRDQEERLQASLDEAAFSAALPTASAVPSEPLLNQVDLDSALDLDVEQERLLQEAINFGGGAKKKSKSNLSSAHSKKGNKFPVDTEEGAFLTEVRSKIMANINEAETKAVAVEVIHGENAVQNQEVDDVMPAPVNDLAPEAQIRLLKAKLRVTQEDVDRLQVELKKKVEECGILQGQLKVTEEEKQKLQRANAAQTAQSDKTRKLMEEGKQRVETLEQQLAAVRKELDSGKKQAKQTSTAQNATEVRLNRAKEEMEKLRSQLNKSRQQARENEEAGRRRVDQLMNDNRRLEKQKAELVAGFKKQLRLIDVLKRQRMHLEAAKMLQFSEEEFVKALDWGS